MPSTLRIARFILSDAIVDTVHIFSLNHTECARILLLADKFYNKEYMDKVGYVMYDAIVESIFSQIFTFPRVLEKSVYYSTLLMDLCRISIDKIPSIFGRCIRTLFSRLDTDTDCGMDLQALHRLSELFSTHLSNFGFSWKWQDWEPVITSKQTCSKYVFVRETLEQCIRLSYYDRIRNCLTEAYELDGQIFPSKAPSFHYNFENIEECSDPVLFEKASALNSMILERQESEKLEQLLLSIETHASQLDPSCDPRKASRRVLIECVMYQGSKSFSHILNVTEKYISILQKSNASMDDKLHTVEIVASFWANNSQFLEIILDKLVNYRVVDTKAIVTYMLSPTVLDRDYSRMYVQNVLKNTLKKVNLRVEQVQLKLKAAQEKEGDEMGTAK